jgi:hypothetical protein
MKLAKLFTLIILLTQFVMGTMAQTPSKREQQSASQPRSSISRLSQNIQVTPQAGTAVSGSGSTGQLARWTGVDGSNSYSLGNSSIFEDKFGKVGIGTTAPTSKLTVQGMIETTLGGYKFPDGTVQTTAANGSVFRDATLKGNGTQASPLGIAVPLALSGATANLPLVSLQQTGTQSALKVTASSDNTNALEVIHSGFSTIGVLSTAPYLGVKAVSTSISGAGLFSENTNGGDSVVGVTTSQFNNGASAVVGRNDGAGNGVRGFSTADDGIGVLGQAGISGSKNVAGRFDQVNSDNPSNALEAVTNSPGFAFYAESKNNNGTKKAAKLIGDVEITGNLSATGTKNFKIDHPLDPENKYLVHAAIESSEVLNVYSGNVSTDASGDAVVQMPEWFEALNKDFRYQLTVIGTFAQAIVASEMQDSRFVIKTNAPNVKVSWQVTGVRNDLSIQKNPMQVEVEKSKQERGFYLQPELYNQSPEKSVEYARQPTLLKRSKAENESSGNLQQRGKLASDN